MKLKDIASQLANRINRPHVIEVYLRQVYAKGFVDGTKQSPWISVNERLPEENTGVLFHVEWGKGRNGYFVGVCYGNGCWESEHWVFLPDSEIGKVSHWMPLPKIGGEE